jgi:hypothetical protein
LLISDSSFSACSRQSTSWLSAVELTLVSPARSLD